MLHWTLCGVRVCVLNWFSDSNSQLIWKVTHAFCWILLNVLRWNVQVCWFGSKECSFLSFSIMLCCFTEFSASVHHVRTIKVMITCLRHSCFPKDLLFLICVCVCVCVCELSCVQLLLTPWTVPGSLQARILEGVAISSSRGSSRPKDRTHISCIAGGFFTTEPLAVFID